MLILHNLFDGLGVVLCDCVQLFLFFDFGEVTWVSLLLFEGFGPNEIDCACEVVAS